MRKTQFVAIGGMLAAVSLALLLLASALPSGQAGVCAAAGVLPAAPLSHKRVKLGICVYLVCLLLGFILLPRKSTMFYYAVFGLYTFIKYALEYLRKPVVEWGGKLTFCNLAVVVTLMMLHIGLMPNMKAPSGIYIAIFLVIWNLIFIAYDIAFSHGIGLLQRIFPKQ